MNSALLIGGVLIALAGVAILSWPASLIALGVVTAAAGVALERSSS